jgi:hypothetical protein
MMSEELGKIVKPAAGEFRGQRKLCFVPLIGVWLNAEGGFADLYQKYWDEVAQHLTGLEKRLGGASRLYHEFLLAGGDEGLKMVKELNAHSGGAVEQRVKLGATLELIEDEAGLTEFMDWSRCLSIGLQSKAVFDTIYAAYTETNQRRNQNIAAQIDATLKADEMGILFMREGHQVQFPEDIQVFYVAPPALDEIKRHLREQEASAAAANNSKAAADGDATAEADDSGAAAESSDSKTADEGNDSGAAAEGG